MRSRSSPTTRTGPACCPSEVDAVIDACDQSRAKARDGGVGAAIPHAVRVRRRRGRQASARSRSRSTTSRRRRTTRCSPAAPAAAQAATARRAAGAIGLRCVFSRESDRCSRAERRSRKAATLGRATLDCRELRSAASMPDARLRSACVAATAMAARIRRASLPCRSVDTLHAMITGSTRGLLAQSVEQRTFNPLVTGSSPVQPTPHHRKSGNEFRALSSVGRAADS